jgi:hypothetical protein
MIGIKVHKAEPSVVTEMKFIYELMQLEYAWLETYARNADFHLFLFEKTRLREGNMSPEAVV